MLRDSIIQKLERLDERHEELSALLAAPETLASLTKFQQYSKEYADHTDLVEEFRRYRLVLTQLQNAQDLLEEADPELIEMAQEEIEELKQKILQLEEDLQLLLIPHEPNDKKNIFLEIRAGTGGDEAAIFAGDLFRMYCRYADTLGWQVEIVSENSAMQGGYKEIIASVSGQEVYGRLKFESGVHRVQRVPVTESQGRIHTSACTVAIMPEVDEVSAVEIESKDLRIDTFRASGAGGQHVNKTDSAIRLTHLPSGIVVECQDERSQHKNRARAMSLLKAKLLSVEQEKQQQEQASTRRQLVGSGDRSERIRTYNFPQGRLTDHRINLTLYKLENILNGDLDPVILPLMREYQMDKLAELQ